MKITNADELAARLEQHFRELKAKEPWLEAVDFVLRSDGTEKFTPLCGAVEICKNIPWNVDQTLSYLTTFDEVAMLVDGGEVTSVRLGEVDNLERIARCAACLEE